MKEYCKENLLKQIDEAATGLRDYLKKCNCKNIQVVVTSNKVEVIEKIGHVETVTAHYETKESRLNNADLFCK